MFIDALVSFSSKNHMDNSQMLIESLHYLRQLNQVITGAVIDIIFALKTKVIYLAA